MSPENAEEDDKPNPADREAGEMGRRRALAEALEDVVDAIGVCGTPYGASRGWGSRRKKPVLLALRVRKRTKEVCARAGQIIGTSSSVPKW